ncbi:MAG: hypothetical protein HUU11_16455 [Anaerolineales bacterium]|nr:hypothetical protein [Anaerolineales bacterium]
MKQAILDHLTITNPARTSTTPTLASSLNVHQAGLKGEVSMWTHEGWNYWWLDGHLWAVRDRSDDERFAGIRNARFRPWKDEDRWAAARVIWCLRAVAAAALLCDVAVVWLAFKGG